MPIKDCQTKKLITETAAKVLFAEGRLNATTQDIADAAGVNRTLINYYFSSKKALVNSVVKSTRKEFIKRSDAILSSDLPFREKTEQFIDDFINNLIRYPYLESFATVDMLQEGLKSNDSEGFPLKQPAAFRQYLQEIKNEMDAGRIPAHNPIHFIMNMFSMMIYPMIMKPLQLNAFNLNETEYNSIMSERKQIILDILFPAIEK